MFSLTLPRIVLAKSDKPLSCLSIFFSRNVLTPAAKLANKLHAPLYKERAEIVKDIKGFWLQVVSYFTNLSPSPSFHRSYPSSSLLQLLNYMPVGVYLSPEDQDALTYLTNLEALEDPTDSRKTVITFEFSENPYFSNTTLVKTFTPKPDAPDYSEYDVEEHSTHEKVKIDWKSDDKNLTKLQPTKGSEEDDEYEPGSFFAVFFESDESLAVSVVGFELRSC